MPFPSVAFSFTNEPYSSIECVSDGIGWSVHKHNILPARVSVNLERLQTPRTTTLFAALDVLEGKVISECHARHRHQEFLKFFRRLDREFPKEKDLHVILDNYGTHRHPRVRSWLEKHPRLKLHFTPTSASWLNLIERWFRAITQERIRRGVFHSVADLIQAIEEYLAIHNEQPKPFVWTATIESILKKVSKCKAIMGTVH